VRKERTTKKKERKEREGAYGMDEPIGRYGRRKKGRGTSLEATGSANTGSQKGGWGGKRQKITKQKKRG